MKYFFISTFIVFARPPYFLKYGKFEFVLKEIFCKQWDQEGKKFLKKVKILNDVKIQKHITNIKNVSNYDRDYTVK